MGKLHRPGWWATGAVVAICVVLVLFTALIIYFWTKLHPPGAPPPACDSCCPPGRFPGSGPQGPPCGPYSPQGTYAANLGEVQGIPKPFGGTVNPFTLTFHPSWEGGASGTADIHGQANMTKPFGVKDVAEKDFKGVPYTFDPGSCAITFDPASDAMKLLAQYGGTLSNVLYDPRDDRVLGRLQLKHTFTVNFGPIHQSMPVDVDQKLAFPYTGPKKPPRVGPAAGSPP